MFSDVIQEFTGSITLQMRHHALLARRRVHLQRQPFVQPHAAFALIGVAFATERRMVELVQLLIGNP